jgi:hypothetical protein
MMGYPTPDFRAIRKRIQSVNVAAGATDVGGTSKDRRARWEFNDLDLRGEREQTPQRASPLYRCIQHTLSPFSQPAAVVYLEERVVGGPWPELKSRMIPLHFPAEARRRQ